MSGKKLVVGLAASIASVAANSHIASVQVSTPALIVNAETSVMSRPAARSDVVEVVPPETVLEVIGHEGDWDWVILPPDVNGTRHSGWIQMRGLTPEKKLQMKQEREAAQKAKEEQAQLKQEEAQRLKEEAQRQKEEQARLKQEQVEKQKQEEAQKQAAKDEEQRMAKAKRELEKARREYERVAASGGTAANSPSNPDDSNPLK
jgi:type IV secretory pathway VirB10-like protein